MTALQIGLVTPGTRDNDAGLEGPDVQPVGADNLPSPVFAAPPPVGTPVPELADPFLYLLAQALSDQERNRIANQNRLRMLTSSEPDADGVVRGFGLDSAHPMVASLEALVEALTVLEHDAELALRRRLRAHPLYPWVKSARGVGEKQAARLLSIIGDPYWNPLHARPRTVSELWAFCGLHVLPAAQGATTPEDVSPQALNSAATMVEPTPNDTTSQRPNVPAADTSSAPCSATLPGISFSTADTHAASSDASLWSAATSAGQSSDIGGGTAARRRKGQRANWSSEARMRAYLVAVSCMKSRGPHRDVYDTRRAHTAATRPEWTPGHSHADGLRVVAKAILRDLWREARAVHRTASGVAV